MTPTHGYSEQSKLEMEKFLLMFAVELIMKGYQYNNNDEHEMMTLTLENIQRLYEDMKSGLMLHFFAF